MPADIDRLGVEEGAAHIAAMLTEKPGASRSNTLPLIMSHELCAMNGPNAQEGWASADQSSTPQRNPITRHMPRDLTRVYVRASSIRRDLDATADMHWLLCLRGHGHTTISHH